jgi:hypothetical protein
MKKIMAFLMAFSFVSATPSDSVQYEQLAMSEEIKKKNKKKGFFSKVFGSK